MLIQLPTDFGRLAPVAARWEEAGDNLDYLHAEVMRLAKQTLVGRGCRLAASGGSNEA
jgi:hypothetical protein